MYKVPAIETAVNTIIKFIFYYRLLFVIASLAVIIFISTKVWSESDAGEEFRNTALVVTCGSVIIGIFYSIINYEHNQLKFRHDVKISRETLTFSTASKMHEAETIQHFRNIKTFHTLNKTLFTDRRYSEIDTQLKGEANANVKISFVVIFNYLEGISIGIEQGIMDEVFMKEFFKTLFKDCINDYGMYIEYLRTERSSPRIFHRFTALAQRWESEN